MSLGDAGQRQTYLNMAATNAANFNTTGWYVLSPQSLTATGTGQEFLMRVNVPEPAAFLLMATGLLLLAAVSRKRLVGLKEGHA